jgi:hypothetical protein
VLDPAGNRAEPSCQAPAPGLEPLRSALVVGNDLDRLTLSRLRALVVLKPGPH